MFRPWMAILLETCNVGPLPGSGPDILPRTVNLRVQRLANTLAFERRCIRSSFVAQVRRTLPVRLHLRALLARRIDALDASGYLRDATLTPAALALVVLLTLLASAGCGRKAMPEPRRSERSSSATLIGAR